MIRLIRGTDYRLCDEGVPPLTLDLAADTVRVRVDEEQREARREGVSLFFSHQTRPHNMYRLLGREPWVCQRQFAVSM